MRIKKRKKYKILLRMIQIKNWMIVNNYNNNSYKNKF